VPLRLLLLLDLTCPSIILLVDGLICGRNHDCQSVLISVGRRLLAVVLARLLRVSVPAPLEFAALDPVHDLLAGQLARLVFSTGELLAPELVTGLGLVAALSTGQLENCHVFAPG